MAAIGDRPEDVLSAGSEFAGRATPPAEKQATQEPDEDGFNLEEELSKLLEGGRAGSASGGASARKASSRSIAKSQYEQLLISKYLSLWGVPPPPGYIEGAMRRGWNVFEFEANERSKASFKFSSRYNEERLGIGLALAQRFGALG